MSLEKFKQAQDLVYHRVINELSLGKKVSHWMWYIFPQIAGLGQSEIAKRFAINSAEEACEYLSNPLLAGRLIECCELLLKHKDQSAYQILGSPDDLKLKSCMTLFQSVAPEQVVFQKVLDCFYQGESCQLTQSILKQD